jgi:molecular chaperone GrpE
MSAGMTRDQILRRFEEWLDGALAAEAPPSGIDAEILSALSGEGAEQMERRCDAYSLWAAVTALTQEVKLQGRAFKELDETIGSQTTRVAEEMRAIYRERERDLQREAERRSRREILGALIDLRDRLGRGLETVRSSAAVVSSGVRVRWLARLVSNPDAAAATLAALAKGYELSLERLDQTLQEFNAREIQCQGEPFDPRRMNSIDKEESNAVPEGTVLEVYRSGYEWNGEVFRPAQVKVSCAPAVRNQHE